MERWSERISQRAARVVFRSMVVVLSGMVCACRTDAHAPSDVWQPVVSILAGITPPVFPDRAIAITQYGARGDGAYDCTEAFRRSIEECAKTGGGRVVVPEGEFLTGPIHLRSNVNLHLARGSVIKFHRDPGRYLPPVFTRWEGVECMNYSPLIYAFEQKNIAITGSGTLDGQANEKFWWPWAGKPEFGWKEGTPRQKSGRDRLNEWGQQGIPVSDRKLGEGFFLRPNFIQTYRCTGVLIEGVTIVNSPMWVVHPVLSDNVTIRELHIDTHGPNNDGVDPESCNNVLIRNCFFNTGDDCIAIKSGRNNDGRRLHTPSQNIVVQGCTFQDGHGGVTIGSEISGGARNIFAEDCEFRSRVLYNALRFKTNAMRGGTIENVCVRNFNVSMVGRAVVDIDLYYEEGHTGGFLPFIRNITIAKMTVKSCQQALHLVGYPEAPIRGVWLEDCEFNEVANGFTIEHVEGFHALRCTINGRELSQ